MSRRLFKQTYRIGGEPILAVYSDSAAVFGALDLCSNIEPDTVNAPGVMAIFFLGGEIADQVRLEIPAKAKTIYSGDAVTIRSSGDFHFGHWYGKAESISDRQNGTAVIGVPGFMDYNVDFISRFVFRPILDRMLFDRGFLPFHAAAVVGETGCLLVGETGSGKTTLLNAMIQRGMGFLSDDRAILKSEGNDFRVCAFPERIRLALSPEGRKLSLDPPEFLKCTALAGMIIFLDYETDIMPRVVEIGAAEASARLAQSVSPYLEPRERIEILEQIARICSRAKCRVIRGWNARVERAALVEKIIREEIPLEVHG